MRRPDLKRIALKPVMQALNGAGAGNAGNGFGGTVTADPDTKTITITYYKRGTHDEKVPCDTRPHPPPFAASGSLQGGLTEAFGAPWHHVVVNYDGTLTSALFKYVYGKTPPRKPSHD